MGIMKTEKSPNYMGPKLEKAGGVLGGGGGGEKQRGVRNLHQLNEKRTTTSKPEHFPDGKGKQKQPRKKKKHREPGRNWTDPNGNPFDMN